MKKKNETKAIIDIFQAIFGLLLLSMIIFTMTGCGLYREIPVQTIEKEVVRDSLIYITDTISIEIPEEKIVQVLPADTVSQIATSFAFSEAKIDKGILTHSLEQKGQIQAKIDTFYITQTKEKIVEKEIPIEVIKEVEHTPNWAWYSVIFNIITILLIAFRFSVSHKSVL